MTKSRPMLPDDDFGKMLAELIVQEEISDIEQLAQEMKKADVGMLPTSLDASILQTIQERAKPTRTTRHKCRSHFFRTAVAIILIVALLGTADLIGPSPVQAFLRYFTSYFTTESERAEDVNFQKLKSYPIPLNWNYLYSPEFIPTGYTISESSNTEAWYGIDYEKQPDQYIRFRCYLKNYSGTLDNENYELIRELEIDNESAILTVSKGITTIKWTAKECFFQISTNEKVDVAEQIAKSVRQQILH